MSIKATYPSFKPLPQSRKRRRKLLRHRYRNMVESAKIHQVISIEYVQDEIPTTRTTIRNTKTNEVTVSIDICYGVVDLSKK